MFGIECLDLRGISHANSNECSGQSKLEEKDSINLSDEANPDLSVKGQVLLSELVVLNCCHL